MMRAALLWRPYYQPDMTPQQQQKQRKQQQQQEGEEQEEALLMGGDGQLAAAGCWKPRRFCALDSLPGTLQ